MLKKLELIEAIVFFIIGAIILVTSIVEQSGVALIVIGALLIVASILHFFINVKGK